MRRLICGVWGGESDNAANHMPASSVPAPAWASRIMSSVSREVESMSIVNGFEL